jgi:hypothetical protein
MKSIAIRWWTNPGRQRWWVAEQGEHHILGDGEAETPLSDPNFLIVNPLIRFNQSQSRDMGSFAQQQRGRCQFRWIKSRWAPGLDIMEDIQRRTATKRYER